MLQIDPVPPIPAPVPSDTNLFNFLTGNRVMKVINSELVPIMIATEGADFYDKNNAEKAADHIVNIIAAKELVGFTKDTLPTALRGIKVDVTYFTSKVLSSIGATHFLHFYLEFLVF